VFDRNFLRSSRFSASFLGAEGGPYDALAIIFYLHYEHFPKLVAGAGIKRFQETASKGLGAMPEQLMTLEQVAEYLNVDKFTVYRLLASKELPAFKVGNQWRFKRKLIENWLKKHSNVSTRRRDS